MINKNQVKDKFQNWTNSSQVLEKIYDMVRIVDPISKEVLYFKEKNLLASDNACYFFWKQDKMCGNCISMRAYKENDTFIKMKYISNKVYLLTAIPLEIDDSCLVIELLKEVTNSIIVEGYNNKADSEEFYKIIQNLNMMVIKDALTGLYNRKYIDERLPVEMFNSLARKQPLSIIMTDLDHFKIVNDQYGHLAGDMVLREYSLIIEKFIRKNRDWASRFGGEEFLICLPNTDSKVAHTVAERMRVALQDRNFVYNDYQFKITASFGICTLHEETITYDSFIECADKMLYKAKELGRNRVCL